MQVSRLAAAAAAVLLLPLGVAVAGSAAASANASAAESARLLAELPSYTCRAGSFPMRPVSASLSPHGAAVYHYNVGKGRQGEFIVPPAGFKPLAASNATLAEMNMPTRPREWRPWPAGRARWARTGAPRSRSSAKLIIPSLHPRAGCGA